MAEIIFIPVLICFLIFVCIAYCCKKKSGGTILSIRTPQQVSVPRPTTNLAPSAVVNPPYPIVSGYPYPQPAPPQPGFNAYPYNPSYPAGAGGGIVNAGYPYPTNIPAGTAQEVNNVHNSGLSPSAPPPSYSEVVGGIPYKI